MVELYVKEQVQQGIGMKRLLVTWFGSRGQGATTRLVVVLVIPTKDSARKRVSPSFFSTFTQRYEAGRSQAQGRMQPKGRNEMKQKRTPLV